MEDFRITAEIAEKLANEFGTNSSYWLQLQDLQDKYKKKCNYFREYKQNLRQKGLCIDCLKPVDRKGVYCQACTDLKKLNAKQKKLESGVCDE
jgi:hypothetical protein